MNAFVRVGAALTAAVVVLAAPTAARADLQGWARIACSSGAIDRVSAAGGILEVDGHVDCAADPETPNAAFMYALYRDKQAVAYWSTVNSYDLAGPATNSIRKSLPAGQFTICLVTDYTVRVACDTVSPGRGGTVIATPLPTDDSQVSREVRVSGHDGGGDPACGTCW
ncbi:hypothetical protein ACIA5D_05895 [Actinoplanes sp. NPDC051513]|uniref:hypothetical protein n=1 Tax=Actinoplanes sp. NPDC051513 TaxID=3363908 RepID=UPI0037977C13